MTRLVVIGDALLDRDVAGTVSRVCPDAPVPVLDVDVTYARPGGAALAATLAAERDVDVTLICALSADSAAEELIELLRDAAVDVCRCEHEGTTAEKVRIRSHGQSLLRVDRGTPGPIGDPPIETRVVLEEADAVLVADYGRGVASSSLIRRLLCERVESRVPIVWDPHPYGVPPIPGTALVTPNRAEAARFAPQCQGDSLAGDVARALHLRDLWRAGAVAVTRGADGALVVAGDDAPAVVPAIAASTSEDACGAGDAFAAAAAVALAHRHIVSEVIEIAVAAAADFVASGGVSQVNVSRPSVSSTTWAPTGGAGWTNVRPTVVATGGCFDLLHAGHVQTLTRARALGDRLVVMLNSDASVRRLKGPGRPVQQECDRAAVLRSLRCVDEVIVFEEDTPEAALGRLRPDVFVKGGDYVASDLPERRVMDKWNGTVVTVPYLAGRSTTSILDRPGGGNHVG